MHLRRAVLLFAIVLGLSAIAASISPPSRQAQPSSNRTTAATTAQAPPLPRARLKAVTMRVPTGRRRPAVRLAPEGHVAVFVSSATPGDVTIGNLDLTQTVEPGTPATFDLFATSAGRYPVTFTPAAGTAVTHVGVIVIRG